MRRALCALPVLAALAGPGAALAAPALTTHGNGSVLEASYRVTIEVHGLYATVETEQRLLGVGGEPAEAVATLELPGDAAVIGFTIAVAGHKAQAGVITTEAGAVGDESATLGDDLGALQQLAAGRPATADDPGAPSTYRYTAYPVGKDGATVTVRWVMPIRLEQGRGVIALPARAGTDLAPAEGTIRFAAVAGLTAPRAVRVGGSIVAKAPGTKSTAWKLAAGAAVTIEAEIAATGDRPVFLADTIALGKGRGAVAAAIVAPSAPARTTVAAADRVVVVVDASRSMRRVDRAAVVAAVGAIAEAAPASAQLEAVGFDHTAHRLLGQWRGNDAATRTALAEAVTKLGDANGTDLAAALAEAAAAIEPGRAARIVVVTDGGVDPTVDVERLLRALGDRADDVAVSSLIVVPADRLAPGHGVAVLSELARRVGGRVRIARADELADRARRLSAELGDGAAWSAPAITGTTTTLAFPAVIAPGDGATAFGWYRGTGKLALTMERDGKPVRLAARSAGGGGASVAAALALAQPGAALALADDPAADTAPPAAVNAWAAAVRARGVVSPTSVALVVDASTRLGRDRRALIARGAPFARLPPPPERDAPLDGPAFGELDAAIATASADPFGGTIDQDSVRNILTLELLGRLRGCYQGALRRDTSLHGRVTFDILMGDGEVMAASTSGAEDPTFRTCLVEAAHQIQVPPVADPTLIRVRYPVDFTVAADKSFVVLGDADSAEPLDPSLLPTPAKVDLSGIDDPLSGLHK